MGRELSCRVCPCFPFLKKKKKRKNYFLSGRQLSGGEICLLTQAGISLKNRLKVIVALKSHTSQMAQSILHQLVWVPPPHPDDSAGTFFCSLSCDEKKYIICHTGFFPPSLSPPFSINKRGQPSINPAITHAITLTIRLSLICVICDMNVEGPPLGRASHSWNWFCILFLQCASEMVAAAFKKGNSPG